jgi:hypothetical protein
MVAQSVVIRVHLSQTQKEAGKATNAVANAVAVAVAGEDEASSVRI